MPEGHAMTDADKTATPPTGRGKARKAALAMALLAGTTLGGFTAGHLAFAATDGQAAAGTPPAVNSQVPAPERPLPDFADLVDKVKPAVVSITTKLQVQPTADEGPEGGQGMPFGMMPFGQMTPHGGQQQEHAVEARGSGFIIDANGTIVTNNHVVKDARSVTVTLSDGTTLPARIIGRDPRTDIAVLKVDAKTPLPFIQLGDSAKVRVGEWVVAMGNPFGLGGTVTAGIVSAKGRDIGEGPYDQFIQIDAPINQGNSGGPLFTQDGKVVGINSAILSPTGGSIGIGFAIPSNLVKTVVAQLEMTGHVTRGYLGVASQPVSPEMAKALHLDSDKGALVASVVHDGPAAKAGVEPGDVIEAVNGDKVTSPRDLATDVAAVKPGDTAKLDILRNGEQQTITVAVAEMPGQQTADAGEPAAPQGRVGVALAPLSPDVRARLDLPQHVKGAVVTQVQPGSAAEAAGIQAGDVIVGVGNKAVGSPEEAVRAIHAASQDKDGALALRILRDGQTAFVAVNLSPTGGHDAG
jgi:serine protease Do